jgi:hypothetical protein
MKDVVYRHIASSQPSDLLKWLSPDEIVSNNAGSAGLSKIDPLSLAYFFHATPTEHNLESILKSKNIEVRHEKAFKGAFVSTEPEYGFGKYVFVFNRSIERLSTLEHGFKLGAEKYWAGFSRNIPINERTLSCIILDDTRDALTVENRTNSIFSRICCCGSNKSEPSAKDLAEKAALEHRIEAWTGRKITVILRSELENRLDKIKALGVGIPKEWPDEGQAMAQKVQSTMQLRLKIRYAEPVAAARIAVRGRIGLGASANYERGWAKEKAAEERELRVLQTI